VFDPAGVNPLANVTVFIPEVVASLPLITPGTHACSLGTIGAYVVATATDATGSFTLEGVPTGMGVPVTVQTGKWRRTVSVSIPTSCATTALPDGTLRLPKMKSEGDLPQMAVLTGAADNLGCFLRAVGLDASEYAAPHGGGRLDVYAGAGGPGLTSGTAGACATGNPVCPLWASKSALEYYDIVLLACEGSTNAAAKPAVSLQSMHDWLGEGGQVFATHLQYYWFQSGPADFQDVATWLGASVATGVGNYTVDTSSQGGTAFDQWLENVGAVTGTTIALNSVASSVSAVSANATRWIYDPNTSPNDTKYLSFLTPIGGVPGTGADGGGAVTYCGKAVFSDLETSGAPSASIPGPCSTTLTSQQKALEFLFFDPIGLPQ
jgi:hypothetical protein